MNTLITAAQVIRLAFAPDDCLPPDAVAESDIAAAEARYLIPVIGQRLHQRLLKGASADCTFVADHLAAPLALFTRALIQPRLDLRTGRSGSTVPKSDTATPAGDSARRALRAALLAEARALLRQAVTRIEELPATYPEYDPARNILKRCSLDGKLVQTL